MKTILFVHANTDDRDMYAEYLRINGFRVIEAATTDVALENLGEGDLMITGLLVPGSVDAVDLIARAKSVAPSRPVVVLTACTIREKHDAAVEAGCDEYLVKPCYPDDLRNVILQRLASTSPIGVPGDLQ